MLRTRTAFIDYVAESPVTRGSIRQHSDRENYTTIFWCRSATLKMGHSIFDQAVKKKKKKIKMGLKIFI